MNMQIELIRDLEKTLKRMERLKQQMLNDVNEIEDGRLMKRKDGRVFKVVEDNGKIKQIKLDKNNQKDQKTIAGLKYKRHIKTAVPILSEWVKYIKLLLKHVSVYDPLKLQEQFKEQYRGLDGLPVFLEGDINPETWGNSSSPPMYEDGLIHPSQKGLMTRSKSEAQIASAYEMQDWKFIYEPVVRLQDGRVLRPDFAVLHPAKRKVIYHEHLGMMDEPDYAMKAIKKLNDYADAGIILGKNLVVTAETRNQPLTFQSINELVKKIEQM